MISIMDIQESSLHLFFERRLLGISYGTGVP